jgi:hypothetical protein
MGRTQTAYAEAQLDVKSDVSNLRLALQPLFPIPVNIVHAPDSNGEPQRRSRPNIGLIPRGGLEANPFFRQTYAAAPPPASEQGAAPDALEFRDVPPGRYHVSVHTFGPECLDTITSGEADLTHSDLTVSEGSPPPPVTVSLRNDCASISGTVRAPNVSGPVYVLLVPESGIGEPITIYAQPNSQFTFPGIRPDAYHVYAVPDINSLEYTNPEALRGLNGQEVTLGANEKATLALDLATGDSQ